MKSKPVFIMIFVIFLLAVTPVVADAQTSIPPTTASEEPPVLDEDSYPFTSLGFTDQVLNGPYDYVRFRFSLPKSWILRYGTSVELDIKSVMTSSTGISQSELIAATGATLDIHFNSKWVTTLVVDWVGDRTVKLLIPQDALKSETGQYSLSVYLDAGIDCKFEHQTTIVVSADSIIELPHELVPPAVDLSKFPEPFYQENSLIQSTYSSGALLQPGSAPLLVIPDNPTDSELQAVLTVSSGLGYLTGGESGVEIVPASALTPEILASRNVIFVGGGRGLGVLKGALLPAEYDGSKFSSPNLTTDDGLIQAAVSPWNPQMVIGIVSGESDAGIIKASQALSSGKIQVSGRPDLAIVKDVTPQDMNITVPVDRTLADLGYPSLQMGGMKYNPVDYLDVQFYVPPGQVVEGQAYVDIQFTNSALLNLDLSGLSVALNGITIGGVGYTPESSQSVTTRQILIPEFLLHPGMNLLSIEANNHPLNYCSDLMYANAWTTLYEQTLIHIPLTDGEKVVNGLVTLGNITEFLAAAPTLDNIGFVVSQASPPAISAASTMAYELGSRLTGDLVELKAVFANNVSETFIQANHLILVGKAAELPLISELGDRLPAPFMENSNVAQETAYRVVYRIPEEASIGYLELLESPWAEGKNILAVLGSTDQGLTDAANAFVVPALKNQLGGNFAAIRADQVLSSDSRYGVGTGNISATLVPELTREVLPTSEVVPAAQVSPGSSVPLANQKIWILPVVGILTGLILLILVVAVLFTGKNR